MERLRAWYASADYAEALAVRQTALDRRLLFVDGAHISPGLGWPDTAEDRATEPPLVSRRNQPQLPATELPRCDIEPHSAR